MPVAFWHLGGTSSHRFGRCANEPQVDPPAGVLYLDEHGWITWADTDAAELFHRAVEDLVGCPLSELLGGDELALQRLTALIGGDPPQGSCELRVWQAQGGWRWVQASVSAETHPAFGGVRVALTDVDRRRRLSDAVQLMVEGGREALWVVDDRGDVVAANRRAATLLGVSPELFYGSLDPDLVARFQLAGGEAVPWLADPVAHCLLASLNELEQVVFYAHPNGTLRRFLARLSLRSSGGEPRALVGLLETCPS